MVGETEKSRCSKKDKQKVRVRNEEGGSKEQRKLMRP